MATTETTILTNDAHSTQNASTLHPHVQPFNDTGIIVSGIIIYIFLLVGIIFNLLTILVIAKYRKLRNIFMYFIFSLCVSDLLSAIISPLFWYRRTLGFESWDLPEYLCKIYWAIDITTTFATAIHILSFGLIRYVSIKLPFFFAQIAKKSVVIWIVSIWVLSIGCGCVPFVLFFGSSRRDRHSDSPDARWPACTTNPEWYDAYTLFQKVAYTIFLCIPFVGVVLLSILIVYTASRARIRTASIKSSNKFADMKRRRKEKQSAMQLVFIVFSFLLGYIPFTAYEFWSVQRHPNTPYWKRTDYWFGMTEYFFIRLSECLNPIFYNLGSSKIRKCTKMYLAEKIKCLKIRTARNNRAASLTGVI